MTPQTAARPGPLTAEERWTLAATVLGSSLAFLDGTVVNVALASLQADLNATAAGVQWVVGIYALMLAALTLTGGALREGQTLATTATGTLTVKGVRRRLSVPVKATLQGGRVHVSTQFKFNPHDYGVNYPGSSDSVTGTQRYDDTRPGSSINPGYGDCVRL